MDDTGRHAQTSPITGKPCGRGGCTAHSKREARLCDAMAVRGTDRCLAHSGKTLAAHRADGEVRLAVQAWGLGSPEQARNLDPGEVLLRLLTQCMFRAEQYAAELERVISKSDNLRNAVIGDAYGEHGKTGEYIKALVRLEADERDRCASYAAKAISAGLAVRQVVMLEKQAEFTANLIRAVFADPELGLTKDQRAITGRVIQRHLAPA